MKNLMIVTSMFLIAFGITACGSSGNPGNDVTADTISDIGYDTHDVTEDSNAPDATDRDTDIAQLDLPFDPDTQTDIVDDSNVSTDTADVTLPIPQWVRMPVTIEDDIVNGINVMTPVDGLTFGYNALVREFVTYFSHDVDNAEIAELWHLDEITGVHVKKRLSGDPIAAMTNFCFDEDWCQFIGYDAVNNRYVVLGPRSPAMMSVDSGFAASQSAITGTQPPNGGISYSHLFAWDIERLLVYGYVTGSSFSKSLFEFNLSSGEWTEAITELPEVLANCLAWDSNADMLYSFGGNTTDDGGETSYAFGKYTVINRDSSSFESYDLPMELASREGMSCAADTNSTTIFVFGGFVINDNWDERQNVYHNDLWALDTSDGTWTKILEDGPTGEFETWDDEDWMLVGDVALPNFGHNVGRMEFDGSAAGPRLILMGDVPGTATQIYTMDLTGL